MFYILIWHCKHLGEHNVSTIYLKYIDRKKTNHSALRASKPRCTCVCDRCCVCFPLCQHGGRVTKRSHVTVTYVRPQESDTNCEMKPILGICKHHKPGWLQAQCGDYSSQCAGYDDGVNGRKWNRASFTRDVMTSFRLDWSICITRVDWLFPEGRTWLATPVATFTPSQTFANI